MTPSLTMIVPALNEEKHLSNTVHEAIDAIDGLVSDYEILIFNDGSTDRTGEIAEALSQKNARIHVIHHEIPRGLGYGYKAGVRLADKTHVLLVPGDNELRQDSIQDMCKNIGQADIVLTYANNPEIRPLSRQFISRLFSGIVRKASGLKVRYFNGPALHRTDLVRRALTEVSDGFAYQAEILVRMIQSGATYVEVGMYLNARPETSAFRMANVINVFTNIIKLYYRLRWHKNPLVAPYTQNLPMDIKHVGTLER